MGGQQKKQIENEWCQTCILYYLEPLIENRQSKSIMNEVRTCRRRTRSSSGGTRLHWDETNHPTPRRNWKGSKWIEQSFPWKKNGQGEILKRV
jgi:hypothetical protein